MKIGCNALYPGTGFNRSDLFDRTAYRQALANLGQAGFEAVEYSHSYHFTIEQAAEVRQIATSLGLEGWSVHAEGPAEFGLAREAEGAGNALRHCLDLCAALGGRVVVVHTPCCGGGLALGDEADVAAALERDRRVLEPACAHAAALGLDIALENGRTLAHMHYILRLRDDVDAANLGFCVDTGHAALGDLGPAQAIRLAGSRLYTTHLQDNLGARDDHLPPGRGTIDWPGVFAALRQVGYQRTLMLELTDSPGEREYDQRLELAQGAANVRRFAEGVAR